MSEFTTIMISQETKQKLDYLKAENKTSYDKLLNKLISESGGSHVDDVITIQRDSTALSLKYWEIITTMDHTNTANFTSYDVTFQELKVEPVGTVFTANPHPCPDNFVNSIAEIVYRKGDDVILLVKELSCINGVVDSISSVVHVNLF